MPHGSFLPSSLWNVTQAERDADWLPVYSKPDSGWDGQFYFRQSTDPFLLSDAINCSDNVSYRYQRNGVPMLAWAVARSFGEFPTSGWTFQFVQFALTSIGFGVLCYWLNKNGISLFFALPWLFCGGIFALFRGLPDSASDGLFILSCYCVLQKHLKTYVVATTLLLLCREGYAIYAAMVFGLSCIGWISWNTQRPWRAGLWTAVPGVCVVAWALYVASRLGVRPLHGAAQVPFGYLVDWPFSAYYRMMIAQWTTHSKYELLLKTLCAVTLLVVLINLLRTIRKWELSAALIPYVVLIAMTGITVWECENGYPKATSAILAIAILQLKNKGDYLVRSILLLHLFMGVQMAYDFNVRYQPYLHQDFIVARRSLETSEAPPATAVSQPINEPLTSLEYNMSGERLLSKSAGYTGLFGAFHREPLTYKVTATNTGNITWYSQPPDTTNCLSMAYQVFDSDGKIIAYNREYLRRNVGPGEEVKFVIGIPLPILKSDYRLVVSMTQKHEVFFMEEQKGHPLRTIITRR